jgi:hypothetical protein
MHVLLYSSAVQVFIDFYFFKKNAINPKKTLLLCHQNNNDSVRGDESPLFFISANDKKRNHIGLGPRAH